MNRPSETLAKLAPLIPRELLFGNPQRRSPAISPDGTRLAWLAPDPQNVLQVWVETIGQTDARIITADKKRGIRRFTWANDSGYIHTRSVRLRGRPGGSVQFDHFR